jgi:excisionase family DNA binding protein
MQSFLNEQEVSKRLNLRVATLRRWRLEKRGPMFVKVGSLVRYRPEDLDSWVAALPTGGDPNGAAVAVMTSRALV